MKVATINFCQNIYFCNESIMYEWLTKLYGKLFLYQLLCWMLYQEEKMDG